MENLRNGNLSLNNHYGFSQKKAGYVKLCWGILILAAVVGACSKPVMNAAKSIGSEPEMAQTNSPVSSLQEFHSRGGLPNLFAKIKSGKEIRIAYFGGSITEARDGWRDLTFSWFRLKFPQTTFRQINAAIGGTGSNLGVFRLEQDVLSRKPDLIFVEFAVNDNGHDLAGIHRSIEGIVRKTWRQNPETEICFVYTLAQNGVKSLLSGKFQNTAIAMEQIADHYQIPSIHMGVEVIRLLETGKLVFTGIPEEHPDKIVFTRDKTHPLSASGHPIYAHVVVKCLQQMNGNAAMKPHQLIAPFVSDNWENAQMVSLAKLKEKGAWQQLPADHELVQKFIMNMPYLYKADKPGAFFTIKFKGKVLGIYDVIGPTSGIVDVVVDGEKTLPITRFDGWCNNYRKNAFFLKGLAEGEHQVTFFVSDEPVDKAGILAKRKIKIKNPADYTENTWIINNVLLVGDLLE